MALRREKNEGVTNDHPSREALWRKRLAHEARRKRYLRIQDEDAPYQEGPRVTIARALLKLMGIYWWGLRNAKTVRLRHLTLTFDALPAAFHGFRILHLSDFHFNNQSGIPDNVYDIVRDLDTDLCVLTGDFRYSQRAPRAYVYEGMERLLARIHPRHGVFAVLGNNDVSDFAERFRAMGVRVLMNEHATLTLNGESIRIAGVDDPHEFACDSLFWALDGIPEGAFTILLAHAPDLVAGADARGVDLYLCGHTHGGQVCLPWLGPPHLNSRAPRECGSGVWRYGHVQGFTTTGIGVSTLPIRFFCPPEAVVIELRRASV